MICYAENQASTGAIDLKRINATGQYLKHYGNLLFLNFLANNSKDRLERA